MIDAPTALRTYLVAQTALTELTSTRIWEQRNNPPKGYLPSQGEAICFHSRGGAAFDYSSKLLRTSWRFKCYGTDEANADALYRTLVDVLHDGKGAGLYRAGLEINGQPLEEPGTNWHYTLCFFETLMQADFVPV